MHISLDQAIGRQPRLNRVGQSLLNIASGASAAYSLRSLTGDEPKAVRIRRDGDNEERDFTTAEIVNEAADWTNGLQETTLPADVATPSAAYSLRKVKSDYTGPAVRIRRTSDDVEVNVAFDGNDKVSDSSAITVTSGSSTATTLNGFLNETTSIYTSDFSGTDGFSGNQGSIASVDGIGSRDDVLRYTINTSTSSFHMAFKNIGTSSETVRVQGSIYIPSSNSHIDSVAIFIDDGGSATQVGSTIVPTADQWVDFDVTGQVSGAKIHFRAKDGGTFTITDSAGDDVFYLDNVRVDATQSNAAVHTWYDQSGNSENATQTTAANQPLIAESGSLLADGLKFDGSDDFIQIDTEITLGTEFFVAGVMILNASGSQTNATILGAQAGGGDRFFLSTSDNKLKYRNNATNFATTLSPSASSNNLILYNATSSSMTTSLNGVDDVDSALAVGMAAEYIGGGAYLSASMSEIIIYNSDQTANGFKIESNINNHYGIYNDVNEFDSSETSFRFLQERSGGTSTSSDLTGFTLDVETASSYAGAKFDSDVSNGDSVFISFNCTFDSGSPSPKVGLRNVDSSLSGTLHSNEGLIVQGFNSFTLTSTSDSASGIVWSEGDDNVIFTISNLKVSRVSRNGFVNTWYDQSGNSRNAVAAADANEPKIVDNGSYLGELSFDGSNDTLSVATISTLGIDGSNNKSAFAVARTTAGTDGFVIAGTSGGSAFQGLRYRSNATNGLARLEVSNFGVEGGDLSDGNNHLYSSIFDGTQTKDFDVSLDGSITQGSGTDVINTDGTATFFIGTVTSNSDAGFTREFILYASDQTSNRTAIETNIANEYGITLS